MNENHHRPTAEEPHETSEGDLVELNAYLAARERGDQPAPSEPGFPSGLAGDLLKLADHIEPEPAFAKTLELQLQKAAAKKTIAQPRWLAALWQSFTIPERKTTMKRLIPFTLVCILLIAILWIVLPSLFPSTKQTQVAQVTSPTRTPAPTQLSPLTPTMVPFTARSPVAINFTPQPIPNQPPGLPSLVNALGSGYGGSGAGILPKGLTVSLATALPDGPSQVNAYYRLENSPLTLDEAQNIAAQWGLIAQFFMPGWMQSVSPNDIERSYTAVDGMQELSIWTSELSYTDLGIFPIYGGHQYPQSELLPVDQAVSIATEYLTSRGYLDFEYQADLSHYNYGFVDFVRTLDGIPINFNAASVKINPQGQVGFAWINREEYQSIGSYPILSAKAAWELLSAGEASDQISAAYYPHIDGNPQYWGRTYQAGKPAQLFGAPTYLLPVDPSGTPFVLLNDLVLTGDLSDLLDYLRYDKGYIRAWGEVQDVNGTRTFKLAGWQPFDESSGYFGGIVRRTTKGDFLELSDGTRLSLPDLPADVPADITVFAEGGRVGDMLEWFILQVQVNDDGQNPPDLSQAQAVIDKIELMYLAPEFNSMTPNIASDPSYRMLVPAWSFSGRITNTGGQEYIYHAHVQAVPAP